MRERIDRQSSLRLEYRDSRGWTPLHFCCSSKFVGFLHALETFIEYGEANGNLGIMVRQQTHNGNTPIHYLAQNTHFDPSEDSKYIQILTRLVTTRSVLKLTNKLGRHALHNAASASNTPAIVALQVRVRRRGSF